MGKIRLSACISGLQHVDQKVFAFLVSKAPVCALVSTMVYNTSSLSKLPDEL